MTPSVSQSHSQPPSQAQSPNSIGSSHSHMPYVDGAGHGRDEGAQGQRGGEEDISTPRRSRIAPRCRNRRGGSVSDSYDMRRAWACEACRISKVRCEQPDLSLPCKRCSKAGRECIFFTQSQKGSKSKSSGRFVELGGKIDHLIATLQKGDSKLTTAEKITSSPEKITSSNASIRSGTSRDQKRRLSTNISQYQVPRASSIEHGVDYYPPQPMTLLSTPTLALISNPFDTNNQSTTLEDIPISVMIETGIAQIISERTAEAIMERYCIELAEQFPAVVILDHSALLAQEGTPKLILRLAILTAACGSICDMDTQKRLRRLRSIVLAHGLREKSEYTLELVQAVIVSALWHTPPETKDSQDAIDIYQLSHSIAHIAVEINLDKPRRVNSQDLSDNQQSSTLADLEAKRTWLACYYLCANMSMPSQQPSLLCWNQYMDECIETLERSPLALPSDQRFCTHVRLQRVADKHSRNLLVNHFFRPGPVSRPDTVEILDSFKQQLASLNRSPPVNLSDKVTRILQHSSTLYLHEIVASIDRSTKHIKSNFNQDHDASPTATSLAGYFTSAHAIVSLFHSLEARELRAMPTVFLVRVIHAVAVLVKFPDRATTELDSGYGTTFSSSTTLSPTKSSRAEDDLDNLVELMASYGAEWPTGRLTQVLTKFRRRVQMRSSSSRSSSTSTGGTSGNCTSNSDSSSSSSTGKQLGPSSSTSYESLVQLAPPNLLYSPPTDLWDDFIATTPPRNSKRPRLLQEGGVEEQLPDAMFWENAFAAEGILSTGMFTPTGEYLHMPALDSGDWGDWGDLGDLGELGDMSSPFEIT